MILLISAHLESGHYFNPHAQRIMEAKAARREARSSSTRGSRTPPRTPTTGSRRSPGSRRRSCSRSRDHLIQHRPLRPRVRAALVELAGVPGRRAARTAEPTFESFEAALARALRRRTRSSSPQRESGVDAATLARGRRDRGAAPARGSPPTPGAAPPPATSAAGRSSRCALPAQRAARRGRAPRAARIPNAWNKFVPRPIHTAAAPADSGTS